MYSEKATKFCEISTRFENYYIGQIYSGDFANIWGLLRIYDLYKVFISIGKDFLKDKKVTPGFYNRFY